MAFQRVLVLLGLSVGGLVVGFIVERIALGQLRRFAGREGWRNAEEILGAFHGAIIFWMTLLGLYSLLTVSNPNLWRLYPNIHSALISFLRLNFILSLTWVVTKVAIRTLSIYTRTSNGVLPSTSIFINIARFMIVTTGVIIALQVLGFSITPILTTLGVGGIAVALALQDTLSNLFAGLQIVLSHKIKPGDFVRLSSGEQGYIVDIAWRTTTLRELENNLVIVPNTLISSALVRNYTLPDPQVAVLVDIGVSYQSDLAHVEHVTIEVARAVMREVPGGVADFEPFIRYNTFADFRVTFTVIMRACTFADQYLIKHEFIKRLHQHYSDEGIEIPLLQMLVGEDGAGRPPRSKTRSQE